MHEKLLRWMKALEKYAERPWYPILLLALSAIDYFVIFIPMDGILVTSAMATPRRWIITSLAVTMGAVLGSVALAAVVDVYGSPAIEWIVPGIHETHFWKMTDGWMDRFGIWALVGIAATPVFQHPAIALAALAQIPLGEIALAVFVGRFFKNGLFAWLGSHAPRVLFRFKGLRKEVEELK